MHFWRPLFYSMAIFLWWGNTATVYAQSQTYVALPLTYSGHGIDTRTGERIRLLDVSTPKYPSALRRKVLAFANATLNKQDFTLTTGMQPRDRYNRILAHVYLTDGTWYNAKLVEEGMGYVRGYPDSALYVKELLTREAVARQAHKGMWRTVRWKPHPALTPFTDDMIGYFYLVEGTVKNTAIIKGTTYLNFDEDWRTDFTVEIPAEVRNKFMHAGIYPHEYFKGKTVRVRGVLKPVNGVLITLDIPEHIEVINTK